MTKLTKFALDRLENIVGKHFLLFPQCLQKVILYRAMKLGICCKGLTLYNAIPCFNNPEEEALPRWLSGERVGLVAVSSILG